MRCILRFNHSVQRREIVESTHKEFHGPPTPHPTPSPRAAAAAAALAADNAPAAVECYSASLVYAGMVCTIP